MKNGSKVKVACCSRRQKVLGVVALAGLFMCGLFVGAGINGNKNLSDDVVTQPDTADMETCRVIENFLLRRINPIDSSQIAMHSENIDIYKMLIENGCPEHVERYQGLLTQESAIIEILKSNQMPVTTHTCSEIEEVLMQSLPSDNMQDSDVRIERAKIYANLSERGCPENSQQYVNLAAKELEIARALRDDRFDTVETAEVVETYKRLEMKQTAKEVLDKVQKLTDPAIDFIIQAQKIIEE